MKFVDSLIQNFSRGSEHHVLILNSCDQNDTMIECAASVTNFAFDISPLSSISGFKRKLNDLKPELLHSHSFFPGILSRHFLPDEVHVATIHNEYPHFKPRTLREQLKLYLEYRSLNKYCSSVVCVSSTVRGLVDAAMPGLPTVTINNGVPIAALDCPPKENVSATANILSLGRLDYQKGYDVLLEAFAFVLRKGVKANLRIVGEGGLRGVLQDKARVLGISDFVSLPGFSSSPTVEFRKADIFVCSSRFEGLSLATAEAMSHALPLVTTNVGGIVPMVRDGLDALIVPKEDPKALAAAICKLVEEPHLRKSIGAAGRKVAERSLSIENTAAEYENLYKRLLSEVH
ncbi:glycosyltransferase family 4 protein [Geomonas anaerohicana]|uniref:Glycosyltransferase family 4 protein n=1 Tax=Geomonas anaerohicana TaxID=2798583 RepID=A0ABS0YC12_9BACT|nr:glycosyltransferase family 4 protein [Geomonas anaerohicana]MBJ6749831.1 glycosyltransferase family 4 protein [Geomonas anaerohicana]